MRKPGALKRTLQTVAKRFLGLGTSNLWGGVREPYAGAWQNGAEIEPVPSIAAFGAFYACATRIANDIGKLEPRLIQRGTDGVWRPAPDNSPFWGPLRRPNSHQNRIQFVTYWVLAKLLYGNAYVLISRDGRGMAQRLYTLDPRRVTPLVTPQGDVYYSLSGDDLSRIPSGMVAPARDVMHDRCPTLWHPLVGVSPVYACGLSATQGLRIQNNSASFFANMSRPSGMLTAPSHIDDETAARLKRDWQANYSANNLGNLAVLGDGLSYAPMTIHATDAQLIEQLRWTAEDIARAFAMPLYKIGAGPMPTSNNVEALHQQYYADTLQTHIEAIELVLAEGLGLPADMAVEFDLDGLLRTDQLTQIEILTKAAGGAIMMPNEARAKRNLPPVAGGSAVYLQQQNYSLEALARRDAQADPFGSPAPSPASSSSSEKEPQTSDEEDADTISNAMAALLTKEVTPR